MSMLSDRSTNHLRRRVRLMTLGVGLLVILSLASMAQMYRSAQSAQKQIELAMRQVSEVTWRIKSIEMWSHLYESEAKHAILTGDSSSLAMPAAFSLTDARALDSLTYLDDVLEWETNQSLTKLIEILEDTSKANLENPEVLVAKLGEISPYRADLVREAGNLNFSHIAEVLTDTTGNLNLSFWFVGVSSLLTVLLGYFLWANDRQLAMRSREQERNQLETLGALTSGFAHVTQNILWCVRASLDQLTKIDGIAKADLEKVDRAQRDVQSLTDMNRALTQAAHDPTQNDAQVSLGEVIENVEARFADNIPKPILAFSKDSAAFLVPSSTFVFLITELLQNANDAIGSNPSASIEVEAAVKGDRLIITVKDTGKGMSDVVLANCTSPFFSTKDNENGHCGLGLHSIYRLVSNLEGTLKVSSTLGQGTTVTISVPRQTA